MSEFGATVRWTRNTPEFGFETFSRDHLWSLTNNTVAASSAPEYRGNPALTNPEEALVAAISSCHMLTFLAIAARKRFSLASYEDRAFGTLGKNEDGKTAMTRVVLRPRVTFDGDRRPDDDEIRAMHDKAHEHCFIANSVKTAVFVEPF